MAYASRMKRAVWILLFVMACTGEKPSTTADKPPRPAAQPPTTAEAKEIVRKSSDFSEFQFTNVTYTLPLKQSMMNEPARAAAADLEKAGWIDMHGDQVLLSVKGVQDKRFVTRPNGFVDIMPLARKEMGEVTAVRPTAEGVDVDFTYKWIPNEIGQAFTSGPIHDRLAAPQHEGTATLIHDGTTWMILRIRPKTR